MNENNLPVEENLQQDDLQKAAEETATEEAAIAEELSPEVLEGNTETTEESAEEPASGAEEGGAEAEDIASEENETEVAEEGAEEAPTDAANEEPEAEPLIAMPAPYHERYYLKYGEGKRTATMDLAGTRAFLQELGYDGGELLQARKGKDSAENFKNAEGASNNQMRCSYCGAEVSGIEFYRLPDGRIRCTSCSNSVVKSKAEIEDILTRVLDNLDNFFGATIDVPIAISVLDERKLKRKVGVPLGTQDDQSLLILGVAINKKKKYSLLIENGAPRISLIATLAHELTHIWQYTHWDSNKKFPKCPKDKRLLIYEGMAKWVEIQYLYLMGEAGVAKREEAFTRNRQDEYGIGFCLFEDAYPLSREAMTCESTPFTTDKYPI